MSEQRKPRPSQRSVDRESALLRPLSIDSNRSSPPEISQFLSSWKNFQLTGRGGSLLDICLPEDSDGGYIPTAVKVINPYGPQFEAIGSRIKKWAQPEELEHSRDLLYVPEGIVLPPEERQNAGFLAFEHQMYERLYSPYILPAVFVAFVPGVDIVEKETRLNSGIETDNRLRAEMIAQDGRRIILKKGVPAVAMVEDYFEHAVGLDGAEPLQPLLREQLRGLISRIEDGFYKYGYYPDPAIAQPNRKNLVVANGDQLVLVDTNFLLSKQSDFAKKDFERILDALYYFAREH